MRLLWIFVLSSAVVLLTMTVGIGAALLLDDHEPWVLLLTFVCVMLLIAIPSLAGIMVANFLFDIEKPDGRRFRSAPLSGYSSSPTMTVPRTWHRSCTEFLSVLSRRRWLASSSRGRS